MNDPQTKTPILTISHLQNLGRHGKMEYYAELHPDSLRYFQAEISYGRNVLKDRVYPFKQIVLLRYTGMNALVLELEGNEHFDSLVRIMGDPLLLHTLTEYLREHIPGLKIDLKYKDAVIPKEIREYIIMMTAMFLPFLIGMFFVVAMGGFDKR